MADLTSGSTSAGGLGTRPARWVFIFVWACGVWLGAIDGYLSPLDPLNASAYLAGLAGGLLLTSPGSRPLSRRRVLWVPVLAIYLTAVALFRSPMVMEVWAVTFASYLVAFLLPRGNLVVGGVGSVLVIGYAAAWGLTEDPTGTDLFLLLGIPVGCLVAGIVWRLVLRSLVRKERAHRGAAAQASERASASEEATVASRLELADIREATSSLLSMIGEGASIDEAMRTRLTLVEASVRDRIRAPQLRHPRVAAESARLRAIGVTVVLLGEPSAGGEAVGASLAAQIVALMSSVSEGRVTLRSLPEGRAAAVSVVIQCSGRSEQVMLDPQGRVVSRV